jgi:hypothetical protein
MKRISRITSLPWPRIKVRLGTVLLLTTAATAAALGTGLDTVAPAAADTTSVSTASNEAGAGGVARITTQNVQLLQLQIQMKHGENRQYTVVGNIMKTKHDTVKNSIGNIR